MSIIGNEKMLEIARDLVYEMVKAEDVEYGESYDIVRHKYTGELRYTNI